MAGVSGGRSRCGVVARRRGEQLFEQQQDHEPDEQRLQQRDAGQGVGLRLDGIGSFVREGHAGENAIEPLAADPAFATRGLRLDEDSLDALLRSLLAGHPLDPARVESLAASAP